jgi:hypothetical protein
MATSKIEKSGAHDRSSGEWQRVNGEEWSS